MDELEKMGIQLALVSIGVPEKGQYLLDHLGITGGERYLYVDPENVVYDELDLNRGVQRTFFHQGTSFAFLDRFTRRDGTKELGEVLSKWNKGLIIPPNPKTQGLNQGGTFLFDGSATIYSHYDPSTAAHAPIEEVIDMASARVKTRELQLQL